MGRIGGRLARIRPPYRTATAGGDAPDDIPALPHFAEGAGGDAFADLRKAMELDPECREAAKTEEDGDFAGLRDDPEFRGLVGLDEEGEGAGDG